MGTVVRVLAIVAMTLTTAMTTPAAAQVLAPMAREQLQEMATFHAEVLGCLIGRDSTIEHVVIVQADGSGIQIARRSACPPRALGYVHNHPTAEKCWYAFPGTAVLTSDGWAAQASPYLFDAIVCGAVLVWYAHGAGPETLSADPDSTLWRP